MLAIVLAIVLTWTRDYGIMVNEEVAISRFKPRATKRIHCTVYNLSFHTYTALSN